MRVAGIPANYVPLVQKAGTVCPEMPAPVIAAQLDQESGFSDPTSSTGAEGPAQFEPLTWVTWGNGGNVHDPVAAIDAQARFDCALAGQVKTAQAAGQIHSSASVTEMALGGFNAGFAAVLASGGIPQNSQTMAYVPRIMTLARTTFPTPGRSPHPVRPRRHPRMAVVPERKPPPGAAVSAGRWPCTRWTSRCLVVARSPRTCTSRPVPGRAPLPGRSLSWSMAVATWLGTAPSWVTRRKPPPPTVMKC